MSTITHKNEKQIGQLLHNDLEQVVLPKYLQVQRLKEKFQQLGCAAMISGSGLTVFTLTNFQAQAEQVLELMKIEIPDPHLDLWVSKFTTRSAAERTR